MGEAARMPELGRNAIKGDLVLELLPPVLRNEAIPPGDAIYPAESPLSSDQDRSRSILRSFSRHLPPRAILLSAASAARSAACRRRQPSPTKSRARLRRRFLSVVASV